MPTTANSQKERAHYNPFLQLEPSLIGQESNFLYPTRKQLGFPINGFPCTGERFFFQSGEHLWLGKDEVISCLKGNGCMM